MKIMKKLIVCMMGLLILVFAGCQNESKKIAIQAVREVRAPVMDEDFESGMGIWGPSTWQAICVAELTSSEAHSGSQCVHIHDVVPDPNNLGINPVGGISASNIALSNKTYVLSMWTKRGSVALDYGVMTASLYWYDDTGCIRKEHYEDFHFYSQVWSESVRLLYPPAHSGALTFSISPRACPNVGDIYIDDIVIREATAQELIDLKYKPTKWEAEIPTLTTGTQGTIPTSGKAEVQQINGQWWCVKSDGQAAFMTAMLRGDSTRYPEHQSFVTDNYGNRETYWMENMWPRMEALGFNGTSINGAAELATTYKGGESGMMFTQSNSDAYAPTYMTLGYGQPASANAPWDLHNRDGLALCEMVGGTHDVPDPYNTTWVTSVSWFYDQRMNVQEGAYPGNYKEAVFYIPGGEMYFQLVEDFLWSSAASSAFVASLQEKYATLDDLKTAWNKPAYTDWADIQTDKPFPTAADQPLRQDVRAFVRHVLSTYSDVCVDAIRTVKPNMQIASPRFHRGCAEYLNWEGLFDTFSRYDIMCFNRATSWFDGYMGMAWFDHAIFQNMHDATGGKPTYSSEWNVLSSDVAYDGSDPHNLYQTQADRGMAYKAFQTQYATMPYMVGSLYFQWLDDPTGSIDGVPRNYGLVRPMADVNGALDTFYQDFVDIIKPVNDRISAIDPTCRTWNGSAPDPIGTRSMCKCTGDQMSGFLLMGLCAGTLVLLRRRKRPV